MAETIKYVRENFPIKIDICISAYRVVSRSMTNRNCLVVRESGLYGVKSFYDPDVHEVTPALFGTIFNREEYAEVLMCKVKGKRFGELEVNIFGEDPLNLIKIKKALGIGVEKILKNA